MNAHRFVPAVGKLRVPVPQPVPNVARLRAHCPSVCPRCGKSPCVCVQLDTVVELSFSADRNGLFTAWNAIANLADMAGEVSVSIRAESAKGFDKAKLQNGVLEPLREADVID